MLQDYVRLRDLLAEKCPSQSPVWFNINLTKSGELLGCDYRFIRTLVQNDGYYNPYTGDVVSHTRAKSGTNEIMKLKAIK